MAGGNFAIVAGINRYPGISMLAGPENDATWFHGWLVKNSLVNEKQARLILSSKFDATDESIDCLPDTAVIDREFERLIRIGVANGKVGGRLYLFFAGHGIGPDLNSAALLGSNVDLRIGTTGHYVNAVQYADWFAMAGYFDEIVLFMDCCRDDMVRAPNRNLPWQAIHNPRPVKRFYGLATKWAKKAREDKAANGDVHGFFTQALMSALEGGAVSKGGTLNTSSLKSFVLNYFTSRIKPKLDPIGAFVEPQFVPDDDFVMGDKLASKETPVSVEFDKSPTGPLKEFSVVGGRPQKLIVNKNGDNPWNLSLAMGHYSLFDPDDNEVQSFDAFGDAVVLHA